MTLEYHDTSTVVFATNTFINTPTILRFDDINLIEIVEELDLGGYTIKIPIFHRDGTHLANVVGTRIYPTEDGNKVSIIIDKHPDLWEIKMDGSTIFQVQHHKEFFKIRGELYTKSGHFIKFQDQPTPEVYAATGEGLQVFGPNGLTIKNATFENAFAGVWITSDGLIRVGVDHTYV